MSRIYYKSSIIYKFYKFWLNYFSPANFTYCWNFGSMALICLILQIITGLFLAMHYKGDANLAFASIEYISREVQYGWFLRYMHSNGASVFFIVVYLHMLRALMHGSFLYPRHLLWTTGVIIFLLMIATAFFWLCFAVRTNEFLGCNSNYQFIFSNTIGWTWYCIMIMRWFFSWWCYIK